MKNLIILDPSLKSFNGHFLTYDNSIAKAGRDYDYLTTVLASKEVVDLPCEFRIIPAFRYGLEYDFIKNPILKRSNFIKKINTILIGESFLKDMEGGMRECLYIQDAMIFLHTTTYSQIPPLVDWLKKNRKLNPTIFIMLRYSPSPNPYFPYSGNFNEYRNALKYIKDSGVSKYFRLIVDSELLQDEYSLLTDLKVHLVPIPHTLSEDLYSSNEANQFHCKLITYLGNARSTKGFQYLPYLIEKIRSVLLSGEWSAEFQANVMFLRDLESVISVAQMRRLPVTLHEYELSLKEYESFLKRSSLILIPYQLLYYHSQTSGVFCEALGAGKPVVVPRGTWMAKQLKDKKAGVTFFPGDRLSFVDATKKAMREIDELTANAKIIRSEWNQYHNPHNFFKTLKELL